MANSSDVVNSGVSSTVNREVSSVAKKEPVLLSVIEMGGYPDFTALYESSGYRVLKTESIRKAVKLIRQPKPLDAPRVIVAEFNFQSDFRDRTSSLETLMSCTQGDANIQVVVFYEKEFESHYQRFLNNFSVAASLTFPINEQQLQASLAALT